MSVRSTRLSDDGVRALAEDAKIGLLATVAEGQLPHLTLITSIQAKSPTRLMFGQFSEGMSKAHLQREPRAGFLALNQQRRWLRGKAVWRSLAKQGEDYEAFNRKPLFRYNAYFGIHTVHYLDIVDVEEHDRLAVAPLVVGAVTARLGALAGRRANIRRALTPWSRRLINRTDALKFLAYVGVDGHPVIVPAVATATQGSDKIAVVPTLHDAAADALPVDRHVALFVLDLEMRSLLVRGWLDDWRGPPGLRTMSIDVDWLYNSMPPKHGQIYPPLPLRPVQFHG